MDEFLLIYTRAATPELRLRIQIQILTYPEPKWLWI